VIPEVPPSAEHVQGIRASDPAGIAQWNRMSPPIRAVADRAS
jgi:hypothetical protein